MLHGKVVSLNKINSGIFRSKQSQEGVDVLRIEHDYLTIDLLKAEADDRIDIVPDFSTYFIAHVGKLHA